MHVIYSAEADVGSTPSGARGTQIIRFGALADRRIDSQPFDHSGGYLRIWR